ncbi:MAG: RNA ligase family protein [Pseudomonadota bacterium]
MKKYGRTFHLPISPGATSDDKIMFSIDGLMVDDLVVTEKMDGENTTIHSTGTYARSPDSRYHPSRDWVKAFAATISPQLKDGERIVGENLFARHSLAYNALPSYFLAFSWIIGDHIQNWDNTLLRFEELGITPVSELYRGPYAEQLFEGTSKQLDLSKQEGFVVRDALGFNEDEMPLRMGKYVRANHVQSEAHWMKSELVPKGLAKN